MKITVERFTSDAETTLSTVFVDGKFACFGLEDEYRTEKVAGETRIPAGTYKVGLRNVGEGILAQPLGPDRPVGEAYAGLSVAIARAAVSSRQPVGTSRRRPLASRHLA